jgi:large repetitive protein
MRAIRRRPASLTGLVLGLCAIAVGAGVFLWSTPSGAAAPTPAPYFPDTAATLGGIDFFDASGTLVTGGSTASPFGIAVAKTAPTGVINPKATLYAYTPVNGVAPGAWSGESLSSSTAYPVSTPTDLASLANPIVTGASGDETLAQYQGDFPNHDTSMTDGYSGVYALRIKITGSGGAVAGYAAADVLVSGSTWTQIDGGYTSPASGNSGAAATSTVVSSASPVSPTTTGIPVTFTATVTPNTAVGAVQFMDNGVALGSAVTVSGGTATSAATSALPAGTHSITAAFTPTSSASFTASTSSAFSYQVNASGGSGATSTSTAVTSASPVSPTTTGTPVTFTATLTPSAAVGAVQFMDNGSALGSAVTVSGGTATSVATSALPAGTHSITAVFTPTSAASFTASTSSAISYVVNAAGATATTTTVAASPPSPTTAGTSVTFTATVTPNTAAGSVQFKDGTNNLGSAVTVASGTATLTTTMLSQATHSISAVFTPTTLTAFNTSTSASISYQVNASSTALTTTTALAVSPATTAATGTTVQLTATVTCTATCTPAGTVNFWDGGSVQIGATQTVVSGSATVSTTTLAIGSSHSFVAIFTPTDLTAFAASQSAAVPYSITSTDSGSATVIDSAGTALGADPTLAPGQVVTVQAGGFTAGEKVSATVHSVPETLIPATATSAGAVAYPFTVPTDLAAGAHSLVLVGATSSHTVTINFSIAAPGVLGEPPATASSGGSLPFTGANVQLLSLLAAVFLCVGMGIRFSARTPQHWGGAPARRGPGSHARSRAKHSRH